MKETLLYNQPLGSTAESRDGGSEEAGQGAVYSTLAGGVLSSCSLLSTDMEGCQEPGDNRLRAHWRDSGRCASWKTEGQFMRWHCRLRVSGKMNWNETD